MYYLFGCLWQLFCACFQTMFPLCIPWLRCIGVVWRLFSQVFFGLFEVVSGRLVSVKHRCWGWFQALALGGLVLPVSPVGLRSWLALCGCRYRSHLFQTLLRTLSFFPALFVLVTVLLKMYLPVFGRKSVLLLRLRFR